MIRATAPALVLAPLLAVLASALPSPARAAAWTVDAAHSTIGFAGTQTGQAFTGRFTRFQAGIDFDPAAPARARISISIDPASATTGDAQRDAALPGRDWFDVATFPQAVFEATGARRTGPATFVADGTLTLRGVRKPVSLPFTFDQHDGEAHATGHLDLTRTVFGIGQGPWASGQWVGLSVGVTIDVTARATP